MKIYVWPDGTWVAVDDYCEVEYASFGDDYYTLDVPDDKVGDMDEAIDAYIAEHGQTHSDQGNDSLGLGMVKVKWTIEEKLGQEGKPLDSQSHKVPSTQVTAFCARLAEAGNCIDVLVNGMPEKDYIDMVRGDTK